MRRACRGRCLVDTIKHQEGDHGVVVPVTRADAAAERVEPGDGRARVFQRDLWPPEEAIPPQ